MNINVGVCVIVAWRNMFSALAGGFIPVEKIAGAASTPGKLQGP
jgi:hypothetical protein